MYFVGNYVHASFTHVCLVIHKQRKVAPVTLSCVRCVSSVGLRWWCRCTTSDWEGMSAWCFSFAPPSFLGRPVVYGPQCCPFLHVSAEELGPSRNIPCVLLLCSVLLCCKNFFRWNCLQQLQHVSRVCYGWPVCICKKNSFKFNLKIN